jgi:hypothetical protein
VSKSLPAPIIFMEATVQTTRQFFKFLTIKKVQLEVWSAPFVLDSVSQIDLPPVDDDGKVWDGGGRVGTSSPV